jgi:hypothetical protein
LVTGPVALDALGIAQAHKKAKAHIGGAVALAHAHQARGEASHGDVGDIKDAAFQDFTLMVVKVRKGFHGRKV